jgi:hypothetical protein
MASSATTDELTVAVLSTTATLMSAARIANG